MLKKILIGLGVLILLLVLAVAIGPRFVDWNAYKTRVIAAVRDATGRELAIDGDISLNLLPSPTLSVAGVRLANLPGGSAPDMARLKSLDVSVALVPLIIGSIQVNKVTLVDPLVLLERLADGRANWQFAAVSGASNSIGAAGNPEASGGTGAIPAVSVDNFTIENGTIIYRSGPTQERIEALNAIVSARSLSGPFGAAGDAKLAGIPAKFEASVGALGAGPTALALIINVAGDAAILKFDGTADQAAATLKGRLDAKIAEPGLILKIAGAKGLPPGLTKPFLLSSSIDASGQSVMLPDIAVALGEERASGRIAAKLGPPAQVEAKLAFGRLDLDKLLPPAAAAPSAAPAPSEGAPPQPTAASPTGRAFALPGDVVAVLDLSAEAVVYHQGVVEHPRLAMRLAEGELQIKQASARLPGATDVSLLGAVAGKGGEPQFVGALQAKSDNLRQLLAWLGAKVPAPSGDRLRNLSLTSRVIASARQAELADLDLKLDATRIQGGVNVALPNGRAKAGFGIGLTVDQVDLDGYMPAKKSMNASGTAGASAGGSQSPARNASPLTALAPLADIDANFDLRAGVLTYNKQAVRGLHLQGTIFQGKLTIADASVKDIGGGQGAISGSVVNLAKDPRYDLKLDLAAQDAAQVFQLAGLGRSTPGKFGALKVNGALKGGASDVDFDLAFAVTGAGVQGSAKGKAQGLQAGLPKVDSTLSASAKNAGPLFQLFGMPSDAAAKLGMLSLAGKAASGADSVDYDCSLDLPGIGGKASFQGKVTSLSKAPQLATNLKFDAAQSGPLLALAGLSRPGGEKLGAFALAGKANTAPDAIQYDLSLEMPALGAKGAFQGKLTSLSKTPQVASNIKLDVAQPGPLLALAGFAGAGTGKLGALALSGRLDGGTDAMKLNLDLAALGGNASVKGNVAAAKSPLGFDLTMNAAHPNLSSLMGAILANYRPSATNPGPLKLNARIAGDTRKFDLSNFALQAGDSDIAGSAKFALGARPNLQGSFASNNLNLAALGAGSGGAGGGGGQAPAAPAPAGQPGGGHWSHQPIDLSALDKGDGALDFKAGHILAGSTRIDDLATRLNLAAGTLAIEALSGKIYGGSFTLQNGRVIGRGTPSFSGRIITSNLELADLTGSGTVRGPISVNADLASSGASQADIVASLKGRGKLAGRATVLSKFEQTAGSALLGALGSKVKALQGITNTLGNVVGLFAGKPNDLAGDFTVDRGVVTTENTTATNPQARALFHGKVNLPPWTLAMLVDIYQLPQTAKPAMTVNLQGPVDRPNVGVSGIALQQSNPGTNPLQQLLQPKQPSTSSTGSNTGGGTSGGTKVDPLAPLLQQLLGGQKTSP